MMLLRSALQCELRQSASDKSAAARTARSSMTRWARISARCSTTPASTSSRVTKGAVYICMSSSELDVLQKAFREAGGHWSTFVIWAKNTFTLGRADYQRQYEPILYGWKKGTDHYWCGARDQGDVWYIDKPGKSELHPTMKPIELVERAIRNSSKSRDIVFDPFGGSGTTLIAAERSGRRARLIELDPKYVDVIVQRWQDASGSRARLGEKRRPVRFRYADSLVAV